MFLENKEIWKPIADYKGLFEVSSLGRIKSLEREVVNNLTGRIHVKPEIICKQQKNGHGYMCITLQRPGKKDKRRRYVHQLVAEAFLSNPNSLHDINHKNEDKTDNRVENLEYCDRKHNMNWGTLQERKRNKMYKNTEERFSDVVQYTVNMKIVAVYKNAGDASRKTGFRRGSISRCCRGERNTYMGYKWGYKKI